MVVLFNCCNSALTEYGVLVFGISDPGHNRLIAYTGYPDQFSESLANHVRLQE